VPLNVERELINGLIIGQVMSLLQDKNADNRIEIFGGSAKTGVEKRAEFTDRQFRKDILPEQTRP